MTDVLITSTEADAAVVQSLADRHVEMLGTLKVVVGETLDAARGSDIAAVSLAKDRLVEWGRDQVLPHVRSLAAALHPVAAGNDDGRWVVKLLAEDALLVDDLLTEIEEAPDAVAVATAARALWEVLSAHLARTDDVLVPLVVQARGTDLAALVEQVRDVEPPNATEGCGTGGHSCGCGETSGADHPELDATTIPHAIRHATIFGALDAVPVGGAMVLVAPHDPLPLLAQLDQRSRGGFGVEYLERGPEKWRLLLSRNH